MYACICMCIRMCVSVYVLMFVHPVLFVSLLYIAIYLYTIATVILTPTATAAPSPGKIMHISYRPSCFNTLKVVLSSLNFATYVHT